MAPTYRMDQLICVAEFQSVSSSRSCWDLSLPERATRSCRAVESPWLTAARNIPGLNLCNL